MRDLHKPGDLLDRAAGPEKTALIDLADPSAFRSPRPARPSA
jgi:hypothetical protein